MCVADTGGIFLSKDLKLFIGGVYYYDDDDDNDDDDVILEVNRPDTGPIVID